MRIATLGLALALTTFGSFAFAFETKDMHSGMTMLETSARQAFSEFGIDADPTDLTLKQLAQIAAALEASQNTEEEMAMAVKAIVAQ